MTAFHASNDRQVIEWLRTASADAVPSAELHRCLERLAERAGLLDVAYRTVESPIGPLLLAATPAGIVRVAFESEGHDAVLARLAGELSPRILHAPRRLEGAARELEQYFTRRRRTFDVDLDLTLAHGFRRSVLAELGRIPYGATKSYAAVARAAGNAGAVRAAASACAQNPLPLFVPCHRVVKSDGSAGEYRGGREAKATLLALEAAG
jgi:methylated-DNA-[protein]-cysteine S-methyltransferase